MLNFLLVILGKTVSKISSTFNLGSGSTWPGHIALSLNKNFIKDVLKIKDQRLKTILIAGTNGKTTTGKLIKTILEKNGKKVFQNESGANLLNGIASSLILNSSNHDYAIFEVDENTLPAALNQLNPRYLILLDLFRDQLDRYGEINTIVSKWKKAIAKLPKETSLILNADDPQIAYLSFSHPNTFYFGLDNKDLTQTKHQHAADSTYCPKCSTKLLYESVYFSHLGIWQCPKCNLTRPETEDLNVQTYPLSGVYNRYNTNAAVLFAKTDNISNETIEHALKQFSPAFGRQEIIDVNGKRVQIFLSKNPTSFNQSLRTVFELGGKNILFVLNDRIPDGRDISWIWDVDFEEYLNENMNILVSGDRVYDMALRIKYATNTQNSPLRPGFERQAKLKTQNHNSKLKIENLIQISNFKFQIEEDLKKAIKLAMENISKTETLYILPTYSAMLEVRKILTGKKIL